MQTTLPLHAAPGEATAHGPQGTTKFRNLTLDDIEADPISQLAKKHYDGTVKPKWTPKLVEDIVEQHLSSSNYDPKKVMLLEFTQYLEKYLWPFFEPETATLNHVLSICLIVNEKARQRVSPWDVFSDDPVKFGALFDRVIRLAVPQSSQLSTQAQRIILMFLILCFQSLEKPVIRTECLKLVSIGIWHNLAHESKRQEIFDEYPSLQKLWNTSNKKYNAADETEKANLEFNRNWLSTLLTAFIQKIYQIPAENDVDDELIMYCERFLEFLIDLEGQLPTRRFFNTLLDDHQIVVLCNLAPFMQRKEKDVDLLKQLLENLAFYAKFEINDQTGLALTDLDMTEQHSNRLVQLQHIIFSQHKDLFPDLPLANLGSIEQRSDLLWHFEKGTVDDLARVCDSIGIRNTPIVDSLDGLVDKKKYMLESLVDKYQKRISQIEKINSSPLYPDETTLFNDTLVQTQFYTGERPLALPKLNLQFLTIHDYLLRNFNLFRLESSYEIRQDIEDVVKRLGPRLTYPERSIEWSGWARMALHIDSFSIVDVRRPELGQEQPSRVTADVSFNVSKYSKVIRAEWDSLRKHDIVFLLTIQPHDNTSTPYKEGDDFRKHFGIKYIRGGEITDVIGKDGQAINQVGKSVPEEMPSQPANATRTLRIALDPNQFKADMQKHNHGHEDVYDTFNILVRRKPQENNFKAVLETIRDLMQSDLVVPDWLQKVFLGYGDPASAHYTNLDPPSELNFRDTFLDFNHLKESLPGKVIEPVPAESAETMVPDFVLKYKREQTQAPSKPKKKSKKSMDVDTQETIEVISNKPRNIGPYPQDIPKQNKVPFTPIQVESIHSGMNHGLTMVVGPPGTGKTDVAVQTIANLYHNHPDQHTLIVTHSNQALNQIFEKLVDLNIDSRHLVRLGHGEEELNTNLSFSKFGRVSSFLERRIELLQKVDKLAQSLGIPGEHGSTCETAGYFFDYHIMPLWTPYNDNVVIDDTVDNIKEKFPFTAFFDDTPVPLFSDTETPAQAIDRAQGCFMHIKKIFVELEEIRPFELLRYSNDRANYLITKEAKIIAMTCTHAALKRRELVGLKFKYDNVVMEEAGQILEVETFIPLLLQEPEDGENRLKRVILIGDHNQLPPVVKNLAFQQYGNMEQSLFTRFIRLGVPALQLDAQGRARSSLAKLYSWRYKDLGDLPNVLAYSNANTGLTYDYQFINVGPYRGQGESEPVPYFYQNLGEAEYVVALYQYMRLVGYPAEKISILTTYNGQRSLINDVLQRRCGWNPFFGQPTVATVDQYQGQQNDYILLSLVRTKTVGHLRDVRRLIVAMSRARLGLYVFGRRRLFENCYELKPVFDQLLARPDKLCLQHSEAYPTQRLLDDTKDATEMDHVEEMGQLVYKLSQEQLDEQTEMIQQHEAQSDDEDMVDQQLADETDHIE